MGGTTRRALVIGAGGQDGSYLCELLVERGTDVVAVVRSDPLGPIPNLEAVRDRVAVVRGDLCDRDAMSRLVAEAAPAEIYNFAAVTFGPDAWADPGRTAETAAVAVVDLLETIRLRAPRARYFQASSAWIFGIPREAPQNEDTPLAPVEPYGAAKAYGNFVIRAFRDRYGLFACSGIFYNHESPRRQPWFASRKITRGVAAIALGLEHELVLGDLEASRDWGYAPDFAEGARRALDAAAPDDYVFATGETHTVRELVAIAFAAVDLDWERYVRSDRALARGSGQVANLVGDASRAHERLGWSPSIDFETLVRSMVAADLRQLEQRDARP